MAGNIFTDGKMQDTLQMPANIFHNSMKRKLWAVDALTTHIHTKHGKGKWDVMMSRSRNGKVTGTQAIFDVGSKRLTYMMVEPDGGRGEVHIVKMEEPLDEAGIMDVIHQEVEQEKEAAKFRSSPFSALAGLKL